jgi:hypothetical protein
MAGGDDALRRVPAQCLPITGPGLRQVGVLDSARREGRAEDEAVLSTLLLLSCRRGGDAVFCDSASELGPCTARCDLQADCEQPQEPSSTTTPPQVGAVWMASHPARVLAVV